jgi:hypothetical protein
MVLKLVTVHLEHEEYEQFKVNIGKKKISVAFREMITKYNDEERKKVEAPNNEPISCLGTPRVCLETNYNEPHSILTFIENPLNKIWGEIDQIEEIPILSKISRTGYAVHTVAKTRIRKLRK